MKRLTLLIIIILLLSSCGKEEVIIKGKVTNISGSPIEGVKVEIEDLGISQFTDSDGSFFFQDSFEEKTYILRFEKEGYKTLTKKIDAIKGENSVNVTLECGTLERILKKRVFIVGMDLNNKPFSFIECSDKHGFDVDLIREIGERMSASPFIMNVPEDELLTALKNGDIDIAVSSLEPQNVDGISFSVPYFIDGYSVVIREREWRIKTGSDLKGKVVEVTDRKLLKRVKELFPGIKRIEYEENLEKAMADLDRVLVDAVVSPYSLAAYYCNRYKKVKMVDHLFDEKKYAIAVRSSDEKLLERIDEILLEMFEDGTYNEIFSKWFYPLDSTRIVSYNKKRNE
ncbi:MAG: hypothetical protein DRI28_04275 [Caldiserica bacterium]|nr:MAG: hypothetical protein DRI28_04275 [Caldisericota bacterium]